MRVSTTIKSRNKERIVGRKHLLHVAQLEVRYEDRVGGVVNQSNRPSMFGLKDASSFPDLLDCSVPSELVVCAKA